jgi:myosin heavy subunit
MSDQDGGASAGAADDSKMINAAIVIQRRMRGILARKRTRARKRQLEVLKVDANGEGSVMHRLEVRAAIKIQARARGMLQRKRMREKALLEQGAKVEDKVKPAGEKPDPKSSKSKKAAEEESHVAKGKSAPKASAKPAVGKDQKKPHADGKVAAPDNGGAAAPAKDVLDEQDLKLKRALEKELDALKVDQMRLKVQMENQKKRLESESQLRLEATARAEAAEEELRYFNTRPSVKSRAHDDELAKNKGLLAAAEERFMLAEGMQSRLQARIELLEKDLADERRRNSAAAADLKEKLAEAETTKSNSEARLRMAQAETLRLKKYMEGMGKQRFEISNALQAAVTELNAKKREAERLRDTIQTLTRKIDSFMMQEGHRMSELASVKTNISELRHAADDKCDRARAPAPPFHLFCDASNRYSAIERLEVQLRQESEGAKLQVAQKKRTDDDFWSHWESQQQVHGAM